ALQRFDEVRVRMPKGVHGNPRRKIEIALAVFRHQPYALPSLEPQRYAIIGLEQGGFGHSDVAPSEKAPDIAGGRTENAARRAARSLSAFRPWMSTNASRPGITPD